MDVLWDELSGMGTLWSFVISHPPLLPYYAAHAPYNVAVVALEEDPGIRLVGNVLAHEGGALGDLPSSALAIGMPLRVVFSEVEGVWLPQWVPADPGSAGVVGYPR